MALSRERVGEMYITLEALLWGAFPVLTVLSQHRLAPLWSLAFSTLCAAFFFAALVGIRRHWHELRNRTALRDTLVMTLLLGVVYYVLFFVGLKYTSAGNASIIALTETLFSFLFFHVWRKEHIPVAHILGACLMLLGAAVVLYPNTKEVRMGDFLILAAGMVAPLGNLYTQRARKAISSETIMWVRNALSAPIIFIFAYVGQPSFSAVDFTASIPFLLANGILVFGLSKFLWVEGIHRMSVTKANAISGLSPLVALVLSWLWLGMPPTGAQLASFLPLFVGMILLTRN